MIVNEIGSIEDIQNLAVKGFKDWTHYGGVNVRQQGDLLIFNYSKAAEYAARWNYFEQVSRGLIIHRHTGEIVARPFDKFYNWLEGGRRAHGHIVTVTEKMDGSLGILYRTPTGYRIATRGSFDGEQAEWATGFLNKYYDLTTLPDELTLLFEIIYPANRIIVDYQDREDLVLLAARNRHTGAYLPFFPDVYTLAHEYGFSLPSVHQFNEIGEIIVQTGTINVNQEGFVVEFSDGTRFKFKGDRYIEMQKVVVGLTFKSILKAVSSGSVQTILGTVPDEFLGQIKQWIAEIQATVTEVKAQVISVFEQAPKASRKEFAIWTQTNHKQFAPYLFALFDDHELEAVIYRTVNWRRDSREEDGI